MSSRVKNGATRLLDAAEEKALIRRWLEAREQDALDALVSAHRPLVLKIANRYRRYGLPLGDLIQEGNIGLLEAAHRFDPRRDVRFATYAQWWIKSAIQEFVLRNGSDAELSSGINNDLVSLLKGQPGVAPGGDSVIGEVVVIVTADLADGSGVSNVLIRGMPTSGMAFRPEAKIVAGRAPAPGSNEVLVGKGISGRFKGLSPGGRLDLRRNRPLKVVGVFEAKGTSYESEVWGDLDVIRTSLGRSGAVSSARVRLASASQFSQFKASVEADKQLGMKAMREGDYYRKQSEATSGFLVGMGIALAILFSLAAMIGAAIRTVCAVPPRSFSPTCSTPPKKGWMNWYSCMPDTVSSNGRRLNSFTPRSASSWRICPLIAGCWMP